MTGWVYSFRLGNGLTKIGVTARDNPTARLKQHRKEHLSDSLTEAYKSGDVDAHQRVRVTSIYQVERAIQVLLAAQREGPEVFALPDDFNLRATVEEAVAWLGKLRTAAAEAMSAFAALCYGPGPEVPNTRQIAAQFGVSKHTVKRVRDEPAPAILDVAFLEPLKHDGLKEGVTQ